MPCSWEGNRRSGVALAMRLRIQWFFQLRAHGSDRQMSSPPMLSCGVRGPCACSVRLRVVALVQENAGSAQSRDHGPVAGRRRRHSPAGLDWTFHGRQVVRGVTLITIVIYLRCFSVITVLLLESWHEEKPCVLRKMFCKLDVSFHVV